jgi:hypothetical protein
MCALHIIAKAAATALLIVTNGSWLLGYIATDHALHLIYRFARGDLVFFAPLPPAASYPVGILGRAVAKAIADFTGTPFVRDPLVCGGAYWLFSLATSQVSVLACVHLYLEYAEAPGGGVDKVGAGVLWRGGSRRRGCSPSATSRSTSRCRC